MKTAFQFNPKQYSDAADFIKELKAGIKKEEKQNKHNERNLDSYFRKCIKIINRILRNAAGCFHTSLVFDDRTALLEIRNSLKNKIKSLEVV